MVRATCIVRKILIVFTAISVVVLFAMSIIDPAAKIASYEELDQAILVGKYRIDNGPWVPYKGQKLVMDDKKLHKVVFKGNFMQEIPLNQRLFLPVSYLDVEIKINGKVFYDYGVPEDIPHFTKTGGNFLAMPTVLDEITPRDEVIINLGTKLNVDQSSRFNEFFQEIKYGYLKNAYYSMIWGKYLVRVCSAILGFAFVAGGLVIAMGVWQDSKDLRNKLLLFIAIAFFGSLWLVGDYKIISLFSNYVILTEFLLCSAVMIKNICVIYYVRAFLVDKKMKRYLSILGNINIFFVLVVVLLQLVGQMDIVEASIPIIVAMDVNTLACVIAAGYDYKINKNIDCLAIGFSIALLLVGMLIDTFHITRLDFTISSRGFVTVYAIIFSLLANCAFLVERIKEYYERIKKTEELEKEIINQKFAIMLSQIQPHFIFNVLTTIRALCRKNPLQAEEAITDFAGFLRRNMESITVDKPIFFKEEMEHIAKYLNLEKLRFGEKLHVQYELNEMDFCVPALSVQTLAENAIKHGLAKRKKGGTLLIKTWKDNNNYYILLKDTGVGFDPLKNLKTRAGLGLKNSIKRIEVMCKGTVEVNSVLGEGTSVIVSLPQKEGL